MQIFVTTQMRAGDEVPDVAAFRSLDSAKRYVEGIWAAKQTKLHDDDEEAKAKIVWHDGERCAWAHEEDDGDGDYETFTIIRVTLRD